MRPLRTILRRNYGQITNYPPPPSKNCSKRIQSIETRPLQMQLILVFGTNTNFQDWLTLTGDTPGENNHVARQLTTNLKINKGNHLFSKKLWVTVQTGREPTHSKISSKLFIYLIKTMSRFGPTRARFWWLNLKRQTLNNVRSRPGPKAALWALHPRVI